jgi:hypothetical protein
MYYSAGIAGSVGAFGAAVTFPHNGPLWLLARLLLDSAGALFGLYLLLALVLSTAGAVNRHRHPVTGTPPALRVRL